MMDVLIVTGAKPDTDRHNIVDSLTPFTQTDKHITGIPTLMGKLFRGILVYHRQKQKNNKK